jgi:aminoglycoside phosphotransferase (APT) family kinase protein
VPAFERRLGTTPWLLRQLRFDEDGAILELDVAEPAWRPPGHARWASRADLDTVRLRDEGHREVLAAYLDEVDPPAERAPWALRGWREQATAWLEAEVSRLGHRLESVEQVKQWSISTILRIRTDGPVLYLKASAQLPLFVDEAQVTAALAEHFPDAVPEPLALHPEGWVLLADLGDPVGWSAPVETRAEMLARFARLQRESAALTRELLAAGCLDRRLPVLESQLDGLVDVARLTDEEREQLRGRLPELKAACRRLGEQGLPPTLVHGDLHLGNVARPAGQLVYFDWTDACVAHPFIDLHSLQWESDDANRAALLDAYLTEWEGVVPEERLREAARLAAVVTPLHHAVSYQHIVAGVERAGQSELDAAHEFVREALGKLETLADT